MEKTYAKQNIFHYIAEFFRSIGASAKAVFATDIEEEKEGLEAFDVSKLSGEDAKILTALQESQAGGVAGIEKAQAKRIEAIDYQDKGKTFKNGMKAEEREAVSEEVAREDSDERELDWKVRGKG